MKAMQNEAYWLATFETPCTNAILWPHLAPRRLPELCPRLAVCRKWTTRLSTVLYEIGVSGTSRKLAYKLHTSYILSEKHDFPNITKLSLCIVRLCMTCSPCTQAIATIVTPPRGRGYRTPLDFTRLQLSASTFTASVQATSFVRSRTPAVHWCDKSLHGFFPQGSGLHSARNAIPRLEQHNSGKITSRLRDRIPLHTLLRLDTTTSKVKGTYHENRFDCRLVWFGWCVHATAPP